MKHTEVGATPFRIEQSSCNQINHFSEREAKTLAAPKVYLPKLFSIYTVFSTIYCRAFLNSYSFSLSNLTFGNALLMPLNKESNSQCCSVLIRFSICMWLSLQVSKPIVYMLWKMYKTDTTTVSLKDSKNIQKHQQLPSEHLTL